MEEPKTYVDAIVTTVEIRLSFMDWLRALFGRVHVQTRIAGTVELAPITKPDGTMVWVSWRPSWWPWGRHIIMEARGRA
jgi:hypothetical protein